MRPIGNDRPAHESMPVEAPAAAASASPTESLACLLDRTRAAEQRDLPRPLARRAAESASAQRRREHVAIDTAALARSAAEETRRSRLHHARQQAARQLGRTPFPPGLTPEQHAQQQALEQRYADWLAEHVIAPRQEIYGDAHYRVDGDMPSLGCQALVPAAYQFVRQFLSSSSRSPVRNALVTALAPGNSGPAATGELFRNNYDPAAIGGVAGGITAYAADAGLTAMDRRAKLANLPQLKPVDVKRLVPQPSEIALIIEGGHKRYAAVGTPGAPTKAELADEVETRRESLAKWQSILSGEGAHALHQPLFAGALNTLRRKISSDRDLLSPGRVFIGSVWASGTGGGLAKGSLELLKAAPWISQARVDDHAGAEQKLNLFTVQIGDPEAQRPGLRELRRLAVETVKEAGAMWAHALDPRGRPARDIVMQWTDILLRHGLSNVFASTLSPGAGELLASLIRGPGGPKAGESLHSSGYLLQQFGQSGTNDFVWQASKTLLAKASHNLAGSLDRKRARASAALDIEVAQASTRLGRMAETIQAQSGGSSAMSAEPWPQEVRQTVERLASIDARADPATGEMREAHEQLKQWTPRQPAGRQARSQLLRALADLMEPQARRAAMEAWRRPHPRAA